MYPDEVPSEKTRLDRPDANNATFISYQDLQKADNWTADYYPLNKRGFYKKLDETNDGDRNGQWRNRPYRTAIENKRMIRSIGDQLGLTFRQRIQAEQWFMSMNLENWKQTKERVAFCLCAYLVHSDERDQRACHPQTPDDKKDPLFLGMERRLDLDKTPSIGNRPFDQTYGLIQSYIQTNRPQYSDPFDRYAKYEDSPEFDQWTDPAFTSSGVLTD